MKTSEVRSKARVIGAVIAMLGLGVLHWAGGKVFTSAAVTSGAVLTSYRIGALAMLLASAVIFVGLILHDADRTSWGLPLIQLGAVVVVLAFLPVLVAAILGMLTTDEPAPVLLFTGICASLGIFVLVLGGQTKAEVDRASRRR